MSRLSSVFLLVFLCVFTVDGAKKMLIDEVNICKRNDPDLEKCYCDNFRRLTPLLKNGIPKMNIFPIDPAKVDNIKLDFLQTKSINMKTDIFDVQIHGISATTANICNVYLTDNGVQLYFELAIPEIDLKALFRAKGNFLLLAIDATGDFHGEFNELLVKSVWNSTHFTKKGRDHLKFTSIIQDIEFGKMKIHFNNLFGNNTELNEHVNLTINENIESLYDEIKSIILETVRGITLKLINDFYNTFPFDVLYPLE